MRKIILILSVCAIVITATLVYLTKNGISLRSAPVIRPSVMDGNYSKVAEAVVLRLFPDLQFAEYLVLGLNPTSTPNQLLLNEFKKLYEAHYNRELSILPDGNAATLEEFKKCLPPCLILTTEDHSNELEDRPLISKFYGNGPHRPYVNITFIPFDRGISIPEPCLDEKRLTLHCLVPLSIHEAERRMKVPTSKYFFVRKYLENDYFIFIQN